MTEVQTCALPIFTRPLGERLHTGVTITGITRHERGVTVACADRAPMEFDEIVLACHGDQVLPLLDDVAGRDVVPLLTRLGDHLGGLDRFVSDQASTLDPTDVAALRDAPEPVAVAAVRAWLRAGNGPEQHPPDAATIGRVLEVARGAQIGRAHV